MKKIILGLLSVLFCAITFAQCVPQGINYQAVARDAAGAELNEMYFNIGPGNALGLGNIGGFVLLYWSSTEYDFSDAWGQVFYDGFQNYGHKTNNFNVRAVRAF